MGKAHIGVIGLGVMGANLARNLAGHGIPAVVYNRTAKVTETFLEEYGNENLVGETELENFIERLEKPRRVLIMVKAGDAVDQMIDALRPLLDKGDVMVDGGNSNFRDTIQREKALKKYGIFFVGMGVSGGEEGALNGPSLMPGGDKQAWEILRPILEEVAAKDFEGAPCVTHVGSDGAGHYVKMVHNGIEYAVMQTLAEVYDVARTALNATPERIADMFERFNRGKLKSFLAEIAVRVLREMDALADGALIDHILDKAGQKGTGRWTVMDAVKRGVAVPTIEAAVNARVTSNLKTLRMGLASKYEKPAAKKTPAWDDFMATAEDAVYAALLMSYAQGYDLIGRASEEHGWNIDLAEVSRIWEGGCIIRADLLNFLHKAYQAANAPEHLFHIPDVHTALCRDLPALRTLTILMLERGIPCPALAASLTYFDSLTQAKSSANFIQGLRDVFGAHTYERHDREGLFHTNWSS